MMATVNNRISGPSKDTLRPALEPFDLQQYLPRCAHDHDEHFYVITAQRWDDCILYGAFSSIERAVESASLPAELRWKQESSSPLELVGFSDGFRFRVSRHRSSSESKPREVFALCRTYMECTMFKGAFDRLKDAQGFAEQEKGRVEWYQDGEVWRGKGAKVSVARLKIDQPVRIEMW